MSYRVGESRDPKHPHNPVAQLRQALLDVELLQKSHAEMVIVVRELVEALKRQDKLVDHLYHATSDLIADAKGDHEAITRIHEEVFK